MTPPPVTHGAYSPGLVAARAKNHRRRFLRSIGVRAVDLDGIAKERLYDWAICAARRDMLPPDAREAWTAANSTARALLALERRLREIGLDRGRPTELTLAEMIAARKETA